MYLGRLQLGDYLSLFALVTNTSRSPTSPDDVPSAKVYDNSNSLVETIKLPVRDKYHQTALFAKQHKLTSSYSTGRYRIVTTAAISSTNYKQSDSFDVVAGGDADGAVIGTQLYECPNADFILFATDGGKLKSGRNPR